MHHSFYVRILNIRQMMSNAGKVYEAVGDVQGEQSCERLIFSGLRFEDIDPLKGTVTLEVTDLELIRKMIEM